MDKPYKNRHGNNFNKWENLISTNRVRNYFFINKNETPQIDLPLYPNGQTYYGRLALKITALQHLFIGCGEIGKSKNHIYDTFTYVKKVPIKKTCAIPGSSLKGTINTNLEMILSKESYRFFSDQIEKSRVFFSDFSISPGSIIKKHYIFARYEPRNKTIPPEVAFKLYKRDDYEYEGQVKQGLDPKTKGENLLILKKACRFNGFIHFHQLDTIRLALLVLAMGSLPQNEFNFKLGGAKNRGMGLVKIEICPEDSYYSPLFLNTIKDRAIPYTKIEQTLVETINGLKERSKKLKELLNKIRGEYSLCRDNNC